ncbi:ribosomal protein L32 [Apiospora sp. TS-2023a]
MSKVMTMTLPPTPLTMKTHPPSSTAINTTTNTGTPTTNPSTPTRPRSTTTTAKGRPRSRSTSPCCPHCGNSLPFLSVSDPHTALLEAQKQIADLEAQVHLLNKKATAAVDRWADYEDELSRLRAASMSSAAPTTTTTSSSFTAARPLSSSMGGLAQAASSRISQLLSPRKSTPNLAAKHNSQQQSAAAAAAAVTRGSFMASSALFSQAAAAQAANNNRASLHPHPLPSPTPSADDLMEALTREQSLRQAAEGRLNETSREVEELSVTLFEQANEMVASERRARAQLEERGSVARIERISRILGEEDVEEVSRGVGGGLAPR